MRAGHRMLSMLCSDLLCNYFTDILGFSAWHNVYLSENLSVWGPICTHVGDSELNPSVFLSRLCWM